MSVYGESFSEVHKPRKKQKSLAKCEGFFVERSGASQTKKPDARASYLALIMSFKKLCVVLPQRQSFVE